jgi:hypothetical protein
MGKIYIDCQDEKDRIITGLAGQLDTYNSNALSRLIDNYIEISFKKVCHQSGENHLSRQLHHKHVCIFFSDT